MNIRTLLLALSLSLLNWILVYFLIEEITIYKYLLIEAITAISTLVYEYEKKKIQTKNHELIVYKLTHDSHLNEIEM